jgi:(R)-2-hydroxyacyl-CoA dehydratese activating ATPase
MIRAGIDAGSRTIKVVLLDAEGTRPLACAAVDQGVRQESLALGLLDRLLAERGLERGDVGSIVATGYGRRLIRGAARTVTEITCQARGVRHVVPEARTVIDVGGQDSKLLRLRPDGGVHDFAMNDRCAAGTGRFLEVVAARLGVELPDLGELLRRSQQPSSISSMCVVFAETEITGILASGVEPADIVAGVLAAIAGRVAAMAGRHVEPPVIFTGGVALVPGMEAALQRALGAPVRVAPEPQMTAALGAALLAGP